MISLSLLSAIALTTVGVINALPPLLEYPSDFGSDINSLSENNVGGNIFAKERLPVSIKPHLYRLELRPILEEGTGTGERFTAPGRIWMSGTANAPNVNAITFHAVDMDINSNALSVFEDGTSTQIRVEGGIPDPTKEFYTVSLGENLVMGRNYTVYVEFTGKVYDLSYPYGLYVSTYRAEDGSDKIVASTDFEAPDARRAFPCFDEPALKAEWEMELVYQSPRFHTLSNMPLRETVDVPGLPGWKKDVYDRSVSMSTYLVCFAISDYTFEEADPSHYSKPVRVWGPPGLMDRGDAEFSVNFSAQILAFFDQHYGIEYHLPKMDKISIPDFASGAMENWGLNTYRDTRILYNPDVNTRQDLFSMTNTISHELVHQWWGNLITCDWWGDLWIQEGAATYYAPVGVEGVGLTDFKAMETLVPSTVQRSFDFDANIAVTHPIHNPDVDPAGSVLFDTLTYHKGASLIRMMNAFLTQSRYIRAMNTFLNRYAWGNANQFELFEVLDEMIAELPIPLLPSRVNVTDVMSTWTLQPGFPVITVERNPFTNLATFTQERFFQRKADNTGDTTKWFVPISIYKNTDGSVSTLPDKWLLNNETSTSMVVTGNWFIVNPQSHGYYRVLYQDSLLDQIIEQLWRNHTVFDVQIRSQLVDDNLNLGFGGYLELSKALNLTLYLSQERELFPWQSFFTNMALPYRMFARSSALSYFKNYVLDLSSDALTAINIEPQPNESNPTTLLRTRLVDWRCNLGEQGCIDFSKSKFGQWMNNPSNTSIVFPDLQPSVYCTAIANGGDAEWNFIIEQYKEANRDVMQVNLLRALGCSKAAFRLNELLDMAIDRRSPIWDKHRATAMQAVAGNTAGANIAFNFIQTNYDLIVVRFGPSMINSVITTLTTQFSSEIEIGNLRNFVDSKPALHLSETLEENLTKNLYWMQNNHQNFTEFIRSLP